MKISSLLLLITVLCVNAKPSYAQNTRLSLAMNGVPLHSVLNVIENQSEFYFLYSSRIIDVSQKVDIEARSEPITQVLNKLLDGTEIKYSINDKQILLFNDELKASLKNQQQSRVNGIVTDMKGIPLAGVTVIVKGSSVGTVTDGNGIYAIQIPNESAVLQFSFIGYGTKEVTVGNQSVINISLEETILQMDEVVVTALGIQREAKSLGYSATSVKTEQIVNASNVNFANNLAGKIAGLNVSVLASGAGGSSKIRIRGQSSFSADNSPLIVINGVPINNEPMTSGNPNAQASDLGDGLQSINPDDIESMTVLKGATAAALYGFRAKDGVIIITTKSGAGKSGLGIEFNTSFTAEEVLDYTDYQYEYGQGEFGIRPTSVSDARSSGGWSFGTKFDGQPVWSIDGQEHPYVPFKDRFKAFYDTGINLTNSLAFSGGNENGSFRVSLSNTNAKNIVPNSTYDKKIMDIGINYKFSDKLSAQLNANYSIDYNKNPPFGGQAYSIPNSIMTMSNTIDPRWMRDAYKDPVTGNEVQWTRFLDRTNWYWSAYERLEESNRNRLFGNISLRYQLLPWLYVQGRLGQDYFSTKHNLNRPTGTANLGPVAVGYNGGFSQDVQSFKEYNLDFLIGADKKIGDFGIDATFGGNSMDQTRDNLGTSVTNFYIRDLYTIGNGQIKSPSYTYSGKRVNSLYGSLNFSYKNYLYFNVTGRNDWFSTLNPESNNYFYPSVSGSFVFSDAFNLPSWISFGKFRASYAEVGGDTDPYRDALYYSMNANTYNGYAYGGMATSVSPNPDLKPLKVKEAEAGLEMIFFDRRISMDFAVYRKNTVDEILNADISNASGFSSTVVNVGRLKNEGFESLITVVPVHATNFTWETGLNYTYNISKVLELAGGQTKIDVGSGVFIGQISHEVGKPMASIRGNDYLRDAQGRIITINGRFQAGDQITFGSAVPKHIGGILNTFTYKGIRLFTQIDFKAGHKLVSATNWNMLRSGHHKNSLPGREGGVVFDGVNPDGTPNTTAIEAESFYTDYSGRRITTEAIYNASFVRWRVLSLGYDFSKLVSKTFIKGLSVNANVNNVLMIKKYADNIDPEQVSSASDREIGLETISLPTSRRYSVSLNFKF
ncbi:MAG TPA: SusC/RagA family TonB-linked outer membrane protein [Bacteroidales bacterium]|nr:SusC/RagA family TonB-linked outer membrane protein [Bacteroidales bacterium]